MVNNYNQPKLDAFKQCLKLFAFLKFKYPLTSIESPSDAILKEVETSMFKFLMVL